MFVSARDMNSKERKRYGKKKKKKRDTLPEQFSSAEEAGEFWDTHSGADYEEFMQPVDFEVNLKRHSTEVRISNEVIRKVRKIARHQGVTSETLVNLWLQEKTALVGAKS
jgi:galactokinase/mevalonate kinase-like predicted kinase